VRQLADVGGDLRRDLRHRHAGARVDVGVLAGAGPAIEVILGEGVERARVARRLSRPDITALAAPDQHGDPLGDHLGHAGMRREEHSLAVGRDVDAEDPGAQQVDRGGGRIDAHLLVRRIEREQVEIDAARGELQERPVLELVREVGKRCGFDRGPAVEAEDPAVRELHFGPAIARLEPIPGEDGRVHAELLGGGGGLTRDDAYVSFQEPDASVEGTLLLGHLRSGARVLCLCEGIGGGSGHSQRREEENR